MEGGALFDPGFLGGQFLWWVGQIPDDATWRENIEPGVYSARDHQLGWGRRYKVRILGVHDKQEETIPSDQLPWATILYPVTAGSGAANAFQSPQIRQGNFVFGFFMDGPDQQVPVIMGILGNNPQTKLSTSTGTTEDNFSGVSGYARSNDPSRLQGRSWPPDDDVGIEKPKSEELEKECAEVPPGVLLNKYGLRADRPLNSAQQKDAASARAEGEAAGLSGSELDEKIKEGVLAGKTARCKKANSPLAQAEPGVALESGGTSPNLKPASSVIRDDLYQHKTVLLKPGHIVESAQKGNQTELDNLSVKVERHLKSLSDYTTAVANKIPDIEKEKDLAAKHMAKLEKISINKMAEYSLKSFFANSAGAMAEMPAASRFQFADVQTGFTNKMQEEYLGITNGLEDSVKGILTQVLDLANKEKEAREKAKSLPEDGPKTYPDVAICTAEELIGKTIAVAQPKINDANNNMLEKMNMFLGDMSSQLAGLTDTLGNIQMKIPDIEGSVASAFAFENLPANVLSFEEPPELAASDFYTMAEGSGAQSDATTPSPAAIGQIASGKIPDIKLPKKIPFAEPSKDQGMVDLLKDKVVNLDLGELDMLNPDPPSPEDQLQSRVLDSMGDYPAGTSVHDRHGGAESYWAKVAKERALTPHEQRWREKGRDQFGYTKIGNEQKKENFRNNIFLE